MTVTTKGRVTVKAKLISEYLVESEFHNSLIEFAEADYDEELLSVPEQDGSKTGLWVRAVGNGSDKICSITKDDHRVRGKQAAGSHDFMTNTHEQRRPWPTGTRWPSGAP